MRGTCLSTPLVYSSGPSRLVLALEMYARIGALCDLEERWRDVVSPESIALVARHLPKEPTS